MAELKALLDEIRRGAAPALTPEDSDRLSGWLCGAANRSGESPDLPRPDHDPVLLQMVYFRLDTALFDGSRLRLEAAGLGPDQSADTRKTRFRRLAGAFHPDRNPTMADWLTTRSQIILEAYGRFKQAPDTDTEIPSAAASPAHESTPPPENAYTRPSRRPGVARRALLALRRRFGHDRYLAHKLIAALALIALLPVLNLWLVSTHAPDPGSARAPLSAVSANDDARPEQDSAGADAPSRTADTKTGNTADLTAEPDDGFALRRAARQAMTLSQESADPAAPLTPVDRQLEALGLVSDRERLYQRMARTDQDPGPAPARLPEDDSRPEPAERDPASAGIEREPPPPGPFHIARATKSPEPPRPPTRSDHDSSTQSTPAAEAATTAAPAAAANTPTLQSGDLALGPWTHSEPGRVLAGFKQDVERGSLTGIASRFAPDVRHDALRGDSAVTDHYRALLDRYSQRRVDLRARRMRRDGPRWRIEAELVITGVRDGKVESVREGRAHFVIGPSGDRLGILRLDS